MDPSRVRGMDPGGSAGPGPGPAGGRNVGTSFRAPDCRTEACALGLWSMLKNSRSSHLSALLYSVLASASGSLSPWVTR